MSKQVKAYEVENLNKVDTTKYKNGDIFITGRSGGILINGTIRPLGLKKSDVKKMIDEAIKKGGGINE